VTKTHKTVADLRIGEVGVIKDFILSNTLVHKLREMGLTCGAQVLINKIAPLGDPIELKIRNYRLSIRRKDARHILLESEK